MVTFFALGVHSPVINLGYNNATRKYDIELIKSTQVCIGVEEQRDWPYTNSWWRGSVWIRFGQPLEMSQEEYEGMMLKFEPNKNPTFSGTTFADAYTDSFKPYLESLVEFLKVTLGRTDIEIDDDAKAKNNMKQMDEFYKN